MPMRRLFAPICVTAAALVVFLVQGRIVGAQTPAFVEWLSRYRTHRDEIRRSGDADVTVREIVARADSDRAGLTLVWALLPGPVTVGITDLRQFGAPYELFTKFVPPQATAAINGGYFGYNTSGKAIPLGLVVSNGKTTNPLMQWTSGGVLVQTPGQDVEIFPIASRRPRAPATALQSKPLLVEHGRVAIRGEDARFNRAAVALTNEGVLVAGAFDSFGRALSLKEFATFLVALRELDGIVVETSLNMDGGPGAHLYFPRLKRQYGDQGNNFVPNLVYLTRTDKGK